MRGTDFSGQFLAVADRLVGQYETIVSELRGARKDGREKFVEYVGQARRIKSEPGLELDHLRKQLLDLAAQACAETEKVIQGIADPPAEGFNSNAPSTPAVGRGIFFGCRACTRTRR